MSQDWLRKAMGLSEDESPFPWQEELLARFVRGEIERSLDIPTGLGKTAVMAIWLVARARQAKLPRRLVYVVDRRAVVDQATDVAVKLREFVDGNAEIKTALGLGKHSLPISTLRGQYVDNREWLEDPASPAIIVGTVDMIGSRLLFEGYGTSRKMRPYHAGLLGADALVVLDEAHLVPAFENLLETIAEGTEVYGPRAAALREIVPRFQVISLSATGRTGMRKPFGLTEADLRHPIVRRRLDAPKQLTLHPLDDHKKLKEALAEHAWNVAGQGTLPVRCIVFCDKRKDAEDAREAIEKLVKDGKKQGTLQVDVDTELFVGGRRVLEREEAAKWLMGRGFIAGSKITPKHPTFVFATSAGEVGVDLDADHMVSDLVAWERMIQRLGRVNRRGDGEATVTVIVEPGPRPSRAVQNALKKVRGDRNKREAKAVADYEAAVESARALLKPIEYLPEKERSSDASSGAIRKLKLNAAGDNDLRGILDAATTAEPLRPALSRALVDAWSMTALREHPGRAKIEPWLRGWLEDDPPQTRVVWRTYLPVRSQGRVVADREIEAYFEAAPPHTSEVLETETHRVIDWLSARTKVLVLANDSRESTARLSVESRKGDEIIPLRRHDVAAIALTVAGDLRATLRLENFLFADEDKDVKKKKKEDLERHLAGATLVVDARIAGLRNGLLDDKAQDPPPTVDDGGSWGLAADNEPMVWFRVRVAAADAEQAPKDKRWRPRLRFATELSDDEEPTRWLIVEKWLHDSATEDDRSAGHPQFLETHQLWAEDRARNLAERLGLDETCTTMLATAARLHDEGKRAKRWQKAFNAPGDGVYAKTRGPVNVASLDSYRHEFTSIAVAAKNDDLLNLPEEFQELALHVIAAHHGFARPVISVNGCEDAPPSALEERAKEVALRFAGLQKRWGPWGLAWWEALLRASDQQASRDCDAADSLPAKESV